MLQTALSLGGLLCCLPAGAARPLFPPGGAYGLCSQLLGASRGLCHNLLWALRCAHLQLLRTRPGPHCTVEGLLGPSCLTPRAPGGRRCASLRALRRLHCTLLGPQRGLHCNHLRGLEGHKRNLLGAL